jgi:hypothetical protein
MKPQCRAARDALIDEALGQAEADSSARARTHLERCEECRGEAQQLPATIALLRREAAVAPSPGFLGRVKSALDEADARTLRRPPRRLRGAATSTEGFRFRLAVLAHQLRTSRKWRLRVAAALVPLLFGLGLLLRERMRPPPSPPVVFAPPSRPPPAPPDETRPPLDLQPGSLVDWQPVLEEPKETGRAPQHPSFEELDEPAKQRVTEELVKINRLDEEALERLRTGGKGEETAPPPIRPPTADPARSPVGRALLWLARNQREDGSFTPGTGEPGLDTGVTALALLALVSDGHVGAGASPLDDAAARAAKYLFGQQDPDDGRFRGGRDEAASLFCHSVACYALVEHHVRSRSSSELDPESARADRDRIERALTRLEMDLDRLLSTKAGNLRCAGQNAAWAAIALSRARLCGVDFHLSPSSGRRVEQVLERLRSDEPALVMAASRTIQAMAERSPRPIAAGDLAWAQAVQEVLERPELAEPSLRYLVASALRGAPPRSGRPADAVQRDAWRLFQARLRDRLLALQSPEGGYFDSGRVWHCFGGGTVYETALAVLALQCLSE